MKHLRLILPMLALAFTSTVAVAQDPAPKPEPSPAPAPSPEPQDPPAPPVPAEETPAVEPATPDSAVLAGTLNACRNIGRTGEANPPAPPAPDSAQPATSDVAPAFTMVRLCRSLEGITLTEEQQTRIDSVKLRFEERLAGVESEENLTDDQRRVLGERDNEVRAVLTEEQQIVFDRNRTSIQAPATTPAAPERP